MRDPLSLRSQRITHHELRTTNHVPQFRNLSMPTNVIMPQLGESVVEGTVSKWLKREGDRVNEFDPILEVNTDKVDTEIPSPAAGVLLKVLVPEGTTVKAGTV